jgi:general secretion pathway protein D
MAAAFGLITLTVASRAEAQGTKVRLEVPSGDVGVEDPPFTIDLVVEDVANLGAFQFELRFDPSVLGFVEIERGPFLGSSGRRVECLDPRVTSESVRLTCVTLGAMPRGADGSGVLVTVTLDPAGPGTSLLRLDDVILTHPDGQPIPIAIEHASINVVPPGTPAIFVGTTTPPAATPAHLTPAEATPIEPTRVQPTPTLAGTPATTGAPGASTNNGGTNWPLWGSVIGAASVLTAAAAGLVWWSRARRLP